MELRIREADTEGGDDGASVLALLRSYNVSKAGDARHRTVALRLTNDQDEDVGGLLARCSYDWMFVELLVVDERYRGRGYGTALMRHAEKVAEDHGCFGIWLDTFEFQARGFYETLGFDLFGELDDHPVGRKCHFMQKRLR